VALEAVVVEEEAAVAPGEPVEGARPTSPRSTVDRELKKREEADRITMLVSFAINGSFLANVLLLAIKVFAAMSANSLSVIASLVDSVMDLLSAAVLWLSAHLASRRDSYLFPVGKSRLEPLGIIVFAALMGAASLQVISQGFTDLAAGLRGTPSLPTADVRTFAILAVIVLIKGALYFVCSILKRYSSSVGALALDHAADVFTNLGPLAAVLIIAAKPEVWWLDPAVAISMSIYMVWMWTVAARSQIALITGRAATCRETNEITFLALTHSVAVIAVDTVCAYQVGNKLQVEVDIVLPRDMALVETHNIGEALQRRVERELDNVERCFVHADYEWRDHKKDDEHYDPYVQPSYAPED
jgi:cation diffusion facilitator family transporter